MQFDHTPVTLEDDVTCDFMSAFAECSGNGCEFPIIMPLSGKHQRVPRILRLKVSTKPT